MIEIEVPKRTYRNPLQAKSKVTVTVGGKTYGRYVSRNIRIGQRRELFYNELLQDIKEYAEELGWDRVTEALKKVEAYNPLVGDNERAKHQELIYYTEKTRKLQEFALQVSDWLDERQADYDYLYSEKFFKAAYREFKFRYGPRRSKYRGVSKWRAPSHKKDYWRARIILPDGSGKADYANTEKEAALQFDKWVDEFYNGDLSKKNFITRKQYEQIKKGSE